MRQLLLEFSYLDIRAALLEQGTLVEFATEDLREPALLPGDVFQARVVKVMPEISGAIVDLGSQHGILQTRRFPECEVARTRTTLANGAKGWAYIPEKLREGLSIFVQVRRLPRGGKLARVSPHIVIEGFFLALALGRRGVHSPWQISRETRADILGVLANRGLREDGFEVHPRACFASTDELVSEIERLEQTQHRLLQALNGYSGPGLVYRAGDPVLRLFLAIGHPELTSICVDGDESALRRAKEAWLGLTRGRPTPFHRHQKPTPLFVEHRIDDQIEAALASDVPIPGGGFVRFDLTDAATVVDVNSGDKRLASHISSRSRRSLKSLNFDAARTILTQLRLRNCSGSIIVDFVNAPENGSESSWFSVLKDLLRGDAAITSYHVHRGCPLLHIQRRYRRPSLAELFLCKCPTCGSAAKRLNLETRLRNLLRETAHKLRTVPSARHAIIEAPRELFEYWLRSELDLVHALEAATSVNFEVRPAHSNQPSIRLVT